MALTAGSIAFVGYDADGLQRFAILAVDPLPAGTTVYVTDRTWNGTSFTGGGEGTLTWTVPAGGVASGTLISFDSVDGTPTTFAEKSGASVPAGSVTRNGSFDLEQANEVLYAFIGTNANTPTTFLGAVANDGFTAANGTLTGTGLAAGSTAVNLGAVDPDADFGVYQPSVGGTTFASRAAMLSAVNNPSNWIVLDTSADDSSAYVPFLTNTNSPIQNVSFAINIPAPVFTPFDQHTDLVINAAEAANGETFRFTGQPGNTVTMTFTGTSGTVTVPATESGGVYTASLTPAQLSSLGEGAFTISAQAADAFGNISAPGTGTVTLDTVPPAAPVFAPGDQHVDGFINAAEASNGETFRFTAEPGSTVQIGFTGASGSIPPVTATEGPAGTYSVSLTPTQLATLGDGPVTLTATATDTAGNASGPGTGSVVQDTVPPAAPVFVPGDQHGDLLISPGETGDGETFTFTAEPGSTVNVTFTGPDGSIGPLTATEDPLNPGTFTVSLDAGQLNDLGAGTLTIAATATDEAGNVSDPSGDTIDSVPCFLPGTRIATPSGELAVETLQPGDLVLTADGRAVPLRFLGRRTAMPRFLGAERSNPIRIQAGALAENVPARDLYVSPNHGIVVDGVLAIASALTNGTTITQVPGPGPRFVYYSIETEGHEVILAEGCPVETFMDHVPRAAWDNYADYLALYPEEPQIAEMDLPHAKSHRQVPREVHARIAGRAAVLAPRPRVAA